MSNSAHCADLPMRALRTRRNVAHGLFGVRPTAAIEPLVGPPPPPEGGGNELSRSHRSQRSPRSPVTFSDECFHPPSSVADCVSFGQEDEKDSMSISGSEKQSWAESERDRSDSEGPVDLQEELIRVMNKAVQELELSWNPPKEPSRSKLDSWYFRSSRRQVDSRTSVPFFPDVHDQLVKTLSAPQSACVHSATQAIFSHVDGAEAHGYVCMPPCRGDCRSTSVPCNGQNHGLGYQPTLQAMQDDSQSSQQGLLLGWGWRLCPACFGGASSVQSQAPGGRDLLDGRGERFA